MLVIIYNQSVHFSLAYDYRLSPINLPRYYSLLLNDIARAQSRIVRQPRVNFYAKRRDLDRTFSEMKFSMLSKSPRSCEFLRGSNWIVYSRRPPDETSLLFDFNFTARYRSLNFHLFRRIALSSLSSIFLHSSIRRSNGQEIIKRGIDITCSNNCLAMY